MHDLATVMIPQLTFKTCPQCRGTCLNRIGDIHVICNNCRWDSIESFVDSGNLDALFYQFEVMEETEHLMTALELGHSERAALG